MKSPKRVMQISSSSIAGSQFPLDYCLDDIDEFLNDDIRSVLFIPYASVPAVMLWRVYHEMMSKPFDRLSIRLDNIDTFEDPIRAVEQAEAIFVGGGNTYHLLYQLQQHNLMDVIRERIELGMPYIGSGAGSVLACPTIRTTNSVRIVADELPSVNGLNLVPFQVNPDFVDLHPEGFRGETREQSIREYLAYNSDEVVVALYEGAIAITQKGEARLAGKAGAKIFLYNKEPFVLKPGECLLSYAKV